MFKTTFAAGALALAALFTGALPTYAVDAPLTTPASAGTMVAPAPLSEAEAAALLYMREEEKLAHDVYVTLYEQWGTRVFSNIAASEQSHTDAVATLLDRYGLTDPTTGNALGEFTDPALQTLYDQLSEQGAVSLADALKVGAAIEEIDILDLEQRIAASDHADIAQVFRRLMAGSTNHLRAFVSTLARQTGESYAPQHLAQADYDAILAAGGNGSSGGNRQQGRGRGGRW